jgi:hypothetical protein
LLSANGACVAPPSLPPAGFHLPQQHQPMYSAPPFFLTPSFPHSQHSTFSPSPLHHSLGGVMHHPSGFIQLPHHGSAFLFLFIVFHSHLLLRNLASCAYHVGCSRPPW